MAEQATPVSAPLVVGICLDGVLRDITEPFYRAYVERFGPEAEGPTHVVTAELDASEHLSIQATEIPEEAESMRPLRLATEGEIRDVPELHEVNPYNLLDKLGFKNQTEIDDFVQGESFFIFARAPQAESGLPTWLNQLYYGVKEKGAKLVLLSNDMPKLRPAALFFAANLGGFFDEIRFATSAEGYWENVDVLITASERLLAARPENKRAVHRLTTYNNPENRVADEPHDTAFELSLRVTAVNGIQDLLAYFPS